MRLWKWHCTWHCTLVRIPIDRVVQKDFVITAGQSKYTQNDFHSGQLPTKVVFGFLITTHIEATTSSIHLISRIQKWKGAAES